MKWNVTWVNFLDFSDTRFSSLFYIGKSVRGELPTLFPASDAHDLSDKFDIQTPVISLPLPGKVEPKKTAYRPWISYAFHGSGDPLCIPAHCVTIIRIVKIRKKF